MRRRLLGRDVLTFVLVLAYALALGTVWKSLGVWWAIAAAFVVSAATSYARARLDRRLVPVAVRYGAQKRRAADEWEAELVLEREVDR